MDKLIIGATGVAYAGTRSVPGTAEGAVTPDLLAAGAFGIYGIHRYSDGFEKFALISNAAATANTAGAYVAKASEFNGNNIKFYLGANSTNRQALGATSQPRQSSEISLRGIRRMVGTPYVAAVKGAWTITPLTPPSPGVATDEYVIHVTKTPKTKTVESWTFSVQGVFANATALVTAYKAAIAARFADLHITTEFTASGTATLIITAANYGEVFSFGFDGFAYGSTVANSTAVVIGSGMLYQIAKKELNYRGEQGWLDTIDRRVPGIDQLALEDEYDLYSIDFVNSFDAKHEQDATNTNQETLTVCVPQGSAAALTLELIFAAFLAAGRLSIVPILPAASGGTTTSTTTVAPAV